MLDRYAILAKNCAVNVRPEPTGEWVRYADAQQAVERLERQVAKLREESHKWKCELCNLTPGGSEFADDPTFCAEYVRKARDSQHDMIVKTVKERKAFHTAHTTLRGLVEKLPVAGLPVEHSRSNDFIVLKAGEGWLAHTYNYWAKFATEDEAKAYVALLQYRATLPREGGAQEVGNAL